MKELVFDQIIETSRLILCKRTRIRGTTDYIPLCYNENDYHIQHS